MSSVTCKEIKKMIRDLQQEADEYVIYMYFCDKREEYYIGRSKNMISRHKTHIKRFGDFNFKILKRNLTEDHAIVEEGSFIRNKDLCKYKLLNKQLSTGVIDTYEGLKSMSNQESRDEHKIFMAEYNLKKKEHEDFLSSLDEDSRFTEEYIKPYLAKCEFIEKTCKKNKTKYTRYTCLCKCVINFASNSPLSYEKHILLPTHINIFKKFEHLIKDINLNPIPRDRQEISQFYRVSR
jgi:hypothetical protein